MEQESAKIGMMITNFFFNDTDYNNSYTTFSLEVYCREQRQVLQIRYKIYKDYITQCVCSD